MLKSAFINDFFSQTKNQMKGNVSMQKQQFQIMLFSFFFFKWFELTDYTSLP